MLQTAQGDDDPSRMDNRSCVSAIGKATGNETRACHELNTRSHRHDKVRTAHRSKLATPILSPERFMRAGPGREHLEGVLVI